MSMYRCAVCGSPNVQRIENNDGFSYKKALVGTAVFGTVGAVAGINGKQVVQYSCPDCGFTKPAPMNDVEKTFVDSLMRMDSQLQSSFQSYFDRYAYLNKERMDAASANAAAASVIDHSSFGGESEYTLEQVRQAIEDFHEAFDNNPLLCSIDPPMCKKNPVQDISVYEKGFEALSVIANGLYAYPQLIVNDESSPFGRKSVRRAFIAYVLLVNGSMTKEKIYSAAKQHPYLSKTMDVILDQAKFREKMQPRKLSVTGEIYTPKKDPTYIDVFFGSNTDSFDDFLRDECNQDGYIGIEDEEPISWDALVGTHDPSVKNEYKIGRLFNYAPGQEINKNKYMKVSDKFPIGKCLYEIDEDEKYIEFGYKLSNGSLYVAAVNGLKILDQEHPEIDNRIIELASQLKEADNQFYKNNSSKVRDEKIKQLTEEAKQLRAKFLGKKKNEELAQEKEREIQAIKDQFSEKSKKHSQETAQIGQEIEALKIQRTEYLKSIDRWICIAGPDCAVIPEEKAPTEAEISSIKDYSAKNWSLDEISSQTKVSINAVRKILGLPVSKVPKESTNTQEEEKTSPDKTSAKQGTQGTSSADEIRKFKELLDSGIITQEEFDAKKKQLLGL